VILMEQLKLQSSNFVYRQAMSSPSLWMTFILCVQGSSLLWTPALRHLYQSNAPVQEEGGIGRCVQCVGWRKEQ